MNKNILIITPFFPPQTHAAVFRAYKLVKYLKREGWNPVVLTVDTNYIYQEDATLLDDIAGVPVYRANYIEPTVRGLKKKLFGIDTSYKAMLAKRQAAHTGAHALPPMTNATGESHSWSHRFYNYMLKRWVQVPDRFVGWYPFALRMARRIIRERDISIIYTTCLPFTCNKLGIALRKKMDVKWVADFRDPITYAKRMYSDYLPVFMRQKRIEQQTFEYADAVVGLSSAYLHIFNDLFSGKYDHKCHFIPTGVDDDYIPNEEISKENYLIFVGEYLREYKDAFLKLLRECVNRGNDIKLKVVGNKDINEGVMRPIIEDLHLSGHVEFVGHKPQKELYRLIKAAKAAVLIPGKQALWWTNFAKMVDYIGLQVPVIALVPDISEARSELQKAGLGIFIKDDEAETISQFLNGKGATSEARPDYCTRYLASSQALSFIQIFENL